MVKENKLDVRQQLDFLRSLALKNLSPLQSSHFLQKIVRVEEKLSDKKLYLAVVGEFSSGKSTFINALLRKRILKEAVMPTTACATYIEKGKGKLCLDVSFAAKKYHADETDYGELFTYLRRRYGISIQNIQHLIEVLTSHQEVARDVRALHLSIPEANIPDNIVVIDTPGFNPGDASVDNHFEITQNVVAHVADVALVLMPCEQPFSASVKSFMEEYLHRYLHRCVFVLTRSDMVERAERPNIVDFVKQHFSSDFRMPNAKIFQESAITMLPVVKIPASKKAEWTSWQNEFKNFERLTWGLLSRQKEFILSEHLHALSLELMHELRDALNKRREDCEQQKKFLDANRVEHIKTVTDQLVKSVQMELTVEFGRLESEIGKSVSIAKSHVKSFALTELSPDKYYKIENEIIPKIVSESQKECKQITQVVNSIVIDKLQQKIDEKLKKMQNGFNEHYAMFPALQHKQEKLKISLEKIKTPSLTFTDAKSIINKASSEGGTDAAVSTGTGAAIGAGIGSVIPGIGTLFGAGIGAAIGAFRGLKSASERDRAAYPAVKSAIEAEITKSFVSFANKYKKNLNKVKVQAGNLLLSFGNRHVEVYGQDVEKLIKKQERDIDNTQKTIYQLKESVRLLEDVEAKVNTHLMILKTKVI